VSERLLKKLRLIAQHAETVSAMCRRVEREVASAMSLGEPINEEKVEHKINAIETRAIGLAREVGVIRP
jgi:hypothetical protein